MVINNASEVFNNESGLQPGAETGEVLGFPDNDLIGGSPYTSSLNTASDLIGFPANKASEQMGPGSERSESGKQSEEETPDEDAKDPCRSLHIGIRSSYRALRVLEILQQRTDSTIPVSARVIIKELENPPEGVTPVLTGQKALYAAINALRLAGYSIKSRGTRGYALTSRTLSDRDIRDLLNLVEASPLLSWNRAQKLKLVLIDMGTPSLKREMKKRAEQAVASQEPAIGAELKTKPMELTALIDMAIQQEACIQLETKQPKTKGGFPRSEKKIPLRFRPMRIIERGGERFVVGMLQQNHGSQESIKTIALARIANAALLADGCMTTYAA